MNNKILKSTAEKKRNRFTAFFVSIIFTGFGQIYNGNLYSGIVLLIIRSISLMIIPVYLQIHPGHDSLDLALSSIFFNAVIFIYSPAEALYSSSRVRIIKLKKCNSIFAYAVFIISNIFLTSLSFFIIMNFFDIREIRETSSILFRKGDRVLVLKLKKEGFQRGEMVEYNESGALKTGRIIGAGGDTVKQENYTFSVNEIPLGIGTFDENEMARLALGDYNKILSESYHKIKYPVKVDIEKNIPGKAEPGNLIKNGEFLIAADNRETGNFYRIIKKESITGRIEGVLFSRDFKRMLIKPYLTKI